jgi:ATP-dependent Lhr-like helicase
VAAPRDPLELFSEPARSWFRASFAAPTPAQTGAWGPISRGEHTLLCAPTGSGKTLAAFLWAIDVLGRPDAVPVAERAGSPATSVVYLSPLRALAVDVEKNLRAPLRGIELAAAGQGTHYRPPSIGVRTGDTAASERRSLLRHPPDILITTPESLFLMLTSRARDTLGGVRCVIVDEIHALAPTKRGAHLALSLERLARLVSRSSGGEVQRIGLSATQRPLEVVASFLGGAEVHGESRAPRPVTVVDAGASKELDLRVVVPVADMAAGDGRFRPPLRDDPRTAGSGDPDVPEAARDAPRGGSIWPSIHPRLLELVESHRSTLVFVNARRLAERLASRLNELAHETLPQHTGGESLGSSVALGEVELVKAHHGSLSRERRALVEDELKRGELRGLVATSSLELGIDMGAVDLVVQVASPGSVAAGLQRIGRAGHQVGVPSRGRIFPKHRADLLEVAAVARGMSEGRIERTCVPRNPLDVLAQQLVAIVAMGPDPSPGGAAIAEASDPSSSAAWTAEELFELVRGADSYAELSSGVFDAVLDMLAGRYPAEEFADLRPRVVWDRLSGSVRPRAGAQRLAVTNAGTIPDRGLFGVFLPDGTRVGELDEEMVYESRVGETFLLGASTWQIQEITFERVVVTPAPGRPGKMPFWHGDGPGRAAELGRAMGELVRTLRGLPVDQARLELLEHHHLDDLAADNLLAYLEEQAESTGVVPDDRTIVVERFRDEIGDWRVCIHTPFGSRVHAPWAVVLRGRLAEHFDGETLGVEVLWSDDGIVMRLPDAADRVPLDLLLPDPDDLDAELVAALPSTSAFAARFRECAARALLLPRRRPDRRTPLWQQRQRSADLLSVASRYPSFPVLLETTREMCNDVYDLPALRQVLREVRSRRIRTVAVDTAMASPFARSLLFGWIAVYMYEGDAPLAERRAAALALDRELLGELLGAEELRSLLDAAAMAEVELELQRLTGDRAARDPDELHDLLRVLGPLSLTELAARTAPEAEGSAPSEPEPAVVPPARVQRWVRELLDRRRAIEVVVAGEARLAAAEDAGRLRDGLGVHVPMGLPAPFTSTSDRPLRDLVQRFARTHVPFTTAQVARRLGLPEEVVAEVLGGLAAGGAVLRGEFTPGGAETEWCDAEVLRLLRRRSLAALRREVEPVPSEALARFLLRWQGVGATHRGPDAVAEAVAVLQGAPLVASTLEADLLALRVPDLRPSDLDQLCSTGEVVWLGAGALGAHDGRVRLLFRDQVALLAPPPATGPDDPLHDVLRAQLTDRGASFWADMVAAVAAAGLPAEDAAVLEALWDLVWAGEVTNDALAPLRARVSGGLRRRGSGARSRRRPNLRGVARVAPPAAAGRWALTAPLLAAMPSPTDRAAAQASQLLERYGILTREMALGEGVEGGFAGVYPVLKLMEERGKVRRGYFVEGLGAAQFALPGAVDRLRAEQGAPGADEGVERLPWESPPVRSEVPDGWVLAATDPAQPYGGVLAWPPSVGQPSRSAGAFVVVVGGQACAYLERGGRRLLTFPSCRDRPEWSAALAALVRRDRLRRLQIERVDDHRAAESPHADALRAVGFVDGYKGLTLES